MSKALETPEKVSPQRPAGVEGNFYVTLPGRIGPGMNERVQRLRKDSERAG